MRTPKAWGQESAKFRGETLSDTVHCATLHL